MNIQPLNKKARRLDVLGALLGLVIFASSASADILLAKQNTNLQSFRVAANLDLDGTKTGNQSVSFFASKGTLVRVIFNAVGSIAGGSVNWLDSTIIIKPAETSSTVACTPSNGDNAFVSGAGAATQNDGLVSAVTQCFYKIPVDGVHEVRVLMTPHPAALWRIDDLSIVIDRDSNPQQ